MIIFVAGSTGYTGREVVRHGLARGMHVVAHIRPDSAKLAEYRERFHVMGAVVDTTPWSEAAMAGTLAAHRAQVVFSLLGTTRARSQAAKRRGAPDETYETVDYGLTSILIRAARETGLSPKFVYLSAAGVEMGRGAYYAARRKAEAELRESGLPYVIARPSFITGPERDDPRPLERIGAGIADALLAGAGHLGAQKLRNRYASMSNIELAAALLGIASDPAYAGGVVEAEGLRERAEQRAGSSVA